MNKRWISAGLLAASFVASGAIAAEMRANLSMLSVEGSGKAVGSVVVTETRYGLVFTPSLTDLPPGLHGFHVHEKGDCGPGLQDGKTAAGFAAGGHYDPKGTKKHGLPWGDGHMGDLPGLVVDANGSASYAVLAPRLKMKDVKGRALMVHMGGDNHADHPAPLGGGGARMACGVIQ